MTRAQRYLNGIRPRRWKVIYTDGGTAEFTGTSIYEVISLAESKRYDLNDRRARAPRTVSEVHPIQEA